MHENMNHQEKETEVFERHWQESRALFSKIYKDGLRNYLGDLPELAEAFKLEDHSVRCIDEGTPGGIHIAGSGILLSTKERKSQLEMALEELRGAGADGVYSHEGCGAAKLYWEGLSDDEKSKKSYGEHAIDWAKKLAEILDAPYKGHITKLARPKEFHNAGIVYYDGSGKFDPFRIKEIPDGFIISRYFLDSGYAQDELKVALSIAMGDHGFGDKFTKENPLIVAPIEKFQTQRSGISISDLEREVKNATEQYGDRVVIQGFREPEQVI